MLIMPKVRSHFRGHPLLGKREVPLIAIRERRPSWYLSFEMTCIICAAAFIAGTFTGVLLAYLERQFP